jgi:hypothetical protein
MTSQFPRQSAFKSNAIEWSGRLQTRDQVRCNYVNRRQVTAPSLWLKAGGEVAQFTRESRNTGCKPILELVKIPPRASGFVGVKTTENKKGSRDKISQPLELYGRDGVIRTLDPWHPISFFILLESFQNFTLDFSKRVFT